MKLNFIYKAILGFAGIILVNALATGVWNELLKPASNWILSYSAGIIDAFQSDYIDDIYRRGMQEELRVKDARLLVTVQLISILVLALLLKLFELFPSDKYGRQINKSPIVAKYYGPIVWICFFGFLTNQAMVGYKTLRSASIYENTYRLVEGLRSDISETDYYKIRGAMLQVKTEAQYFKVLQMLAKSTPDHNSYNQK